MKKSDALKKAAKAKRKKPAKIKTVDLLSTGSTQLNLAFSGKSIGGIPKGSYINLVGDSNSGKTWLSYTILAEASINPEFDDYDLIHNDAEGGALFDVARYFGKQAAERIQGPDTDEHGNPVSSSSIEEFYDDINSRLEDDRKFIYIMDSMDVLTSESEQKKIKQQKAARIADTKAAGSMTDAKAKYNSQHLRGVVNKIKSNGSILIIISQTRDNMGFGAQYTPKTRAGGHALKFYATLELWMARKQKIRKTIRGKPRTIGIVSKVKIDKNRITGRNDEVDFPILYSMGIDDIGSCIDYLIEEKYWKVTKSTIKATDFDFEGKRSSLISFIEKENYERDLQLCVEEVWKDIIKQADTKRKSRYE